MLDGFDKGAWGKKDFFYYFSKRGRSRGLVLLLPFWFSSLFGRYFWVLLHFGKKISDTGQTRPNNQPTYNASGPPSSTTFPFLQWGV